MTTLNFTVEERALRNPYSYARSTIAVQEVIVVEVFRHGHVGRGECSPYSSFFERPTQEVIDQIRRVQAHISDSFDRVELMKLLPAGPARCAIDCALWDLEAKVAGRPVYELAARARPLAVSIAYTIGLDSLDVVQKTAELAAHLPILKIKGGLENDAERVQIVRQAAPLARLTIDPNGGWSVGFLKRIIPVLEACNIEMLEQPLQRVMITTLLKFRRRFPFLPMNLFPMTMTSALLRPITTVLTSSWTSVVDSPRATTWSIKPDKKVSKSWWAAWVALHSRRRLGC
ncbi:hypothetical protein KVG95_09535 [Pseudomonas sp. SWRI79]|uniref:Mandelate racemase/muconate lactonizing enzyme C-terminal domain-containing protein n=1 Tax=Pseudomonas farris TaxID=2841207 RepID=A0ABS6PTM4_9PSED|nr:enolase C-terminal domain-like protein [Pseudomonas farris]MBV4463579.1 hypothetical protein [Pseudomonas farris]